MVRFSQKGDTPMTDKDREQYLEVLFALSGYYEKIEKEEEENRLAESPLNKKKLSCLSWMFR